MLNYQIPLPISLSPLVYWLSVGGLLEAGYEIHGVSCVHTYIYIYIYIYIICISCIHVYVCVCVCIHNVAQMCTLCSEISKLMAVLRICTPQAALALGVSYLLSRASVHERNISSSLKVTSGSAM